MACEERVFPIKSNWADCALDGVGVDLDPSIGEECLQSTPVAVDIAQFFAEAGFARDAGQLRFQPEAEVVHQRFGSGLPHRVTLARGCVLDFGLNLVEFGDPAQALGGDFRTITVIYFLQLASGVGPSNTPASGGRRRGCSWSAGCSRHKRQLAGCP